jgi:hypothetical protein
MLAVAASGCGGSKKSSSSPGSQTRTVQMDGVTSAFHGSFLAYFPKTVMVHPGDSVRNRRNLVRTNAARVGDGVPQRERAAAGRGGVRVG